MNTLHTLHPHQHPQCSTNSCTWGRIRAICVIIFLFSLLFHSELDPLLTLRLFWLSDCFCSTDGRERLQSSEEGGDQCSRGRKKDREECSQHARDLHCLPHRNKVSYFITLFIFLVGFCLCNLISTYPFIYHFHFVWKLAHRLSLEIAL